MIYVVPNISPVCYSLGNAVVVSKDCLLQKPLEVSSMAR